VVVVLGAPSGDVCGDLWRMDAVVLAVSALSFCGFVKIRRLDLGLICSGVRYLERIFFNGPWMHPCRKLGSFLSVKLFHGNGDVRRAGLRPRSRVTPIHFSSWSRYCTVPHLKCPEASWSGYP
jgi:hypothetical protein